MKTCLVFSYNSDVVQINQNRSIKQLSFLIIISYRLYVITIIDQRFFETILFFFNLPVEDPIIDNLSDMVSANVSGRGTPNVSGRDTPSSQVKIYRFNLILSTVEN